MTGGRDRLREVRAGPPTATRPPMNPNAADGRREVSGAPLSVEAEDALAGRLGVEQLVGLRCLVEGEEVGQQLLERHLPIDDEAGALGLADRVEGPGAVERQLSVDDVR